MWHKFTTKQLEISMLIPPGDTNKNVFDLSLTLTFDLKGQRGIMRSQFCWLQNDTSRTFIFQLLIDFGQKKKEKKLWMPFSFEEQNLISCRTEQDTEHFIEIGPVVFV